MADDSTYDYVKRISSYYAYWDFDEDENLTLDYEASARAVWRWLMKENILNRVRKFREEWMLTEYLHMSIMDYYSMFEPIQKTTTGRK